LNHRPFFIAIAIVVFVCVLLTAFALLQNNGSVAEIYQDGQLLHTISLSTVEKPYEITVGDHARHNIILVERGKISMKAANCPDGLCKKVGAIKNSSYPIVCLPNKVIIKIKGGEAAYDTPDAISK